MNRETWSVQILNCKKIIFTYHNKADKIMQKVKELDEQEFEEQQKLIQKLEENIEEACLKYFKALYIEVPAKKALCFIDTLYKDDSFMVHLKFCKEVKIPNMTKVQDAYLEYLGARTDFFKNSSTENVPRREFNDKLALATRRLIETLEGKRCDSDKE